MSSLKINYIYTVINTVSGLLFPLITFPYISRVLMADRIGLYNFYSAIVSYIITFSCLGIPIYAVREVSKVKNDKYQLSKISLEIFILNLSLTTIGYAIVGILILTIERIQENIPLFLICSLSILFQALGIDWFYNGREDFKYISIRSITFKLIAVIMLFVFVHDKSDLLYYALVNLFAISGNYLFNFFRAKLFISFNKIKFRELDITKHIRPCLAIFFMSIITSIYVQLDSVMLGFLSNNASVGYYTSAEKLTKMIMGLLISLCTIILPRFSSLVSLNKLDDLKLLGEKGMNFTFALSLPLCFGLFLLAGEIIILFCGEGFIPSIHTLQILSPIIVFISISNLFAQGLLSLNKEKTITMIVVIIATVNLILNLFLIPRYSQNGSAWATVIAEFIGCVLYSYYSLKNPYLHFFCKGQMKYILSTFIMCIFVFLVNKFFTNYFYSIITSIVVGSTIYILCLLLLKDKLTINIKDQLLTKIRNNR